MKNLHPNNYKENQIEMDLFMTIGSAVIGATFGYVLMEGPGRVLESVLSSTIGCIEGLTYGQGMGMVFRVKKSVYVKSNQGLLRLPSFNLPNLETEVSYFYGSEDRFEKDELYDDDMIDNEHTHAFTTYMNNIIPDMFYAPCDMWLCVSNIFEGEMYPHFIKSGNIIDYKKILEIYENKIEQQ